MPLVHFDLDAFFASVEVALRPELAGRPVVVGGTGPRGVVSCASYPARTLGAHAAMPMYRARQLGTLVLPVRMRAYQLVSEQVQRLTAEYGDVRMFSLDEGVFHLDGSFEDALVTARQLRRKVFDELGLSLSVGVAPSRATAKIASELAKPGKVRVLLPDKVSAILGPLPVGDLPGCGPKTTERLKAFGVVCVNDLLRADEGRLRHIIGSHHLEVLVAVARGIEPAQRERREQTSVSAARTFDGDLPAAAAVDEVLILAAHAWARLSGGAARNVTVAITDHRGRTRSRQQRFPSPTENRRRAATTVQLLVTELLRELTTQSIRAASVAFERSGGGGQGELFDDDSLVDLPEIADERVTLADVCFAGMRLAHPVFGEGTVLNVERDGSIGVCFADRIRLLSPQMEAPST